MRLHDLCCGNNELVLSVRAMLEIDMLAGRPSAVAGHLHYDKSFSANREETRKPAADRTQPARNSQVQHGQRSTSSASFGLPVFLVLLWG
jgi:hypothetical protein